MSNLLRGLRLPLALPLLLLVGALSPRPAPSLLVYDFNLGLGTTGNVNYLDTLGFDGLVTRVESPADLVKFADYVRHASTLPGFDVLAFVTYDFEDAANARVWREALPLLARAEAPLWVIVRRAPSPAALRLLLARMAIESQAFGVETVIYPHWNTDIESAEHAAWLVQAVNHPNLKNSLHSCHEIRAGHQDSLATVAAHFAGGSSLVTIAGADEDAYAGPHMPGVSWDDAIKPLDRGDFSLLPFLQGLHDADYGGRVVLHTFGITDDPGHLERSLRKYEEYLGQILP